MGVPFYHVTVNSKLTCEVDDAPSQAPLFQMAQLQQAPLAASARHLALPVYNAHLAH